MINKNGYREGTFPILEGVVTYGKFFLSPVFIKEK